MGTLNADEEELRQYALADLHKLVDEEARLLRASFIQLSSTQAVPPEGQETLRGTAMRKLSDVQLNIHPPEEDTADIIFSLETLRNQVGSSPDG